MNPMPANFDNIKEINRINTFGYGIKQGLPIALGYFPVSFTFGLMAVEGGIPAWAAILISMTNLTSAGQFAGTKLIMAGSGFVEIGITTFVINIRYMLMSLSLSQKVDGDMGVIERMIIAFGITDETFAVASMEKKNISYRYMLGLITCPYWGWALGTIAGAATCSVLPKALCSSMGIALYAMFIALVVPAAKKSRPALVVMTFAIIVNTLLKYLPLTDGISAGWRIIISTVSACTVGALLYGEEEHQ